MKTLRLLLVLTLAGCATTPKPDSADPDRWTPRRQPVYPMPFTR